ncbi:MAG: 4'-phosphopantetheinyl transferase superfamily protein [Acidimicrobiales bacterium]
MVDDRDHLPGEQPAVRVGVDLTAVDEVADSVARLGERYLRRLFTDHEVASSRGPEGLRAESLAARFAAKEAAVKVLRPDGSRPEWRNIEVWRSPDGWCDLRLHGSAAALAARRGVDHLSVSLSHEAGVAVAVVAATCRAGAGAGTAAARAATVETRRA